jgi:hypothetical protein
VLQINPGEEDWDSARGSRRNHSSLFTKGSMENGCAGQSADSSSYGLACAAWWSAWQPRAFEHSSSRVRMSHSSPSISHCRAQVHCCLRAATTHTRLHAQSHLSELFIVMEGGKDAATRIEQPAAAGPLVALRSQLPIIPHAAGQRIQLLGTTCHSTCYHGSPSGVSTPRNAKYTD